jgi:hypothetical protein
VSDTLDLLRAISSIAIIVGIVIAILQLRLCLRIAEVDHDRRKKQATIEFHDTIQRRSRPIAKEIASKCGKSPVTMSQVQSDADLEDSIAGFLTLMERFSVGIRTGVYDFDVYALLHSTSTINIFHQLREYIQEVRRVTYPTRYIEFEALVRSLEERQLGAASVTGDVTVKSIVKTSRPPSGRHL